MLAFASVPLYRLFCQVTGFAGTTQQSKKAADHVVTSRTITVRFNADTQPDLPWKFLPDQREVTLHPGEQKLVSYTAQNLTNEATHGHATYNVVPYSAGAHFVKIECFCFKEQTLEPNQTVHMPVLFYIDPDIMEDADAKDVHTITLSYTFFAVKDSDQIGTTKPLKNQE